MSFRRCFWILESSINTNILFRVDISREFSLRVKFRLPVFYRTNIYLARVSWFPIWRTGQRGTENHKTTHKQEEKN